MAKPKKKITFFPEAKLMADEDGYPLQQEIEQYTIQRDANTSSELALKGKKNSAGLKLETGLIDRLLKFMRRHGIEVISLGDYSLERYSSYNTHIDSSILRELKVPEAAIEAATVRVDYETIKLK